MTNFLKESAKNLKNNFILLISSIFFIILNFQNKSYILYQGIACLFIFLLFTRAENIFEKTKKASKFLKFLAIMGSIGIVYFIANRFWINIQVIMTMSSRNISRLIYIIMICSSFSIYTFLVLLYDHLFKIFYDVFHGMTKLEKIVYLIIAVILMTLIIVISIKTNVFYSQEYVYDVIFTSDIGAIVRDNAYMNLYHPENDIRQPLFAVFAMPFMAIAYTISLIFPFFYPINEGILFSIIQGLLIFWSNILIANLLKINSKNRILFVILSMVMYMSILYTFSLEQYAVAYFWLIVCIYAICNNKQDELVIAGAGGTLLTSLLLAFWIPKDISLKKLKDYVLKLIKVGIVFGCLVCIFGRIDVIMPKNMKSKSKLFSSFVKVEEKNKNDTALKSKLKQYTSFIKSCFISPDTVEVYKDNQVGKYNSIQLQKVNGYSYLGILIFIIALIGLIVTRKEKISQLAGVWMFFSLMLLGTIGWGAKENGMILYILYFGWSFLVLIYQLIKAICEKIKLKYLLNFVTISLIIVCMICNYKGLKELLDFAITSYPN